MPKIATTGRREVLILRRRLWTFSIFYIIILGLLVWFGGRELGIMVNVRIFGIALIILSCLGLLLLNDLAFLRPLRRKIGRLDDLVRTLSPNQPPRVRDGDELDQLRADLRRMIRTFDEARGDLSTQRLRAEVDSRTDPLTKLYNHRSFVRMLGEEWGRAKISRLPLALLIIDVDFFKSINDELGHLAGNEVLESIAGLIKESVRQSDLVFRYAGDEFAVLLPRTGLEQALLVAEKIRLLVNAQTAGEAGYARQLSVSLGAAEVSPELRESESMVELADRALYQGKQAGRNIVAYALGRGVFRLYRPGRETKE